MVDRTRKEFSDEDIARKLVGTYHAWLGKPGADAYEDVPGFCRAVTLEEIRGHNHILTPGRYVGAAETKVDDVPFEDRFAELKKTLTEQFAEAAELSALIQKQAQRGQRTMDDCRWTDFGSLYYQSLQEMA